MGCLHQILDKLDTHSYTILVDIYLYFKKQIIRLIQMIFVVLYTNGRGRRLVEGKWSVRSSNPVCFTTML